MESVKYKDIRHEIVAVVKTFSDKKNNKTNRAKLLKLVKGVFKKHGLKNAVAYVDDDRFMVPLTAFISIHEGMISTNFTVKSSRL